MNGISKINKDWDFTIGLEIHVQLDTNSKMFSSCEYSYDKSENSLTCPTSLGLPGALPTINERAIDFAIKFGLAVKGNINLSFSTKSPSMETSDKSIEFFSSVIQLLFN